MERPPVINLTLDTMVMDNDEAQKRHGVQPTYKKVKGFQPLQMIWKNKIVECDIPWRQETQQLRPDSGKYGDGDSRAYTERIQRDSADNPENRQRLF